ncbi:hypothetical protein [Allosphingosinicella vermicomposti]|uniref:hypothetical protein n=1 Tax=Allosphingosinicella vermicomposti TaxID=614671 RepID=UPI00131A5594|nr:hypothetical protein [Allosphingosinicella vermicomposti]
MNLSRHLLLTGAALAAAACVPKPEAPAPRPAPPPVPPPPPAPAPPPAAPQNWADIPLTPGTWFYRDQGATSAAMFGVPASEGQFTVRCDKASGRIALEREGAATSPALAIRTSFTVRSLPATVAQDPMPRTAASLAAQDPLLDSMAFSRGRFSVEAAGLPMLILPAWPEVARTVEDCRR